MSDSSPVHAAAPTPLRPIWRRPAWIATALVLVCLAVVGVRITLKAFEPVLPPDPPPTVSVVLPIPGDVPATVTLVGAISARNDMPIGPEGDGGRIAKVFVEAGDHVRAGQLLAQIDPSVAQSQVAAAEASLVELRASADVADAEFKRAESARGVFSTEELERRRTTALTARAKLNVADAQLNEARSRLARTRIVAPSDGFVLTRTAEVGQIAAPGATVLFHLAQNSDVEMRGQVAESDMPRLRDGQIARVYLNGVTEAYQGRVWQVGATIDATSREGSVRIALPRSERNLRPGAFARAEIAVGATQGSILPQTAVLSDEHGTYVLAVLGDGKLERRAVTVAGARRDGLIVSAGLTAGDRIVSTAGAFLRAGESVTVAQQRVEQAAAPGAGPATQGAVNQGSGT